MTHRISCLISLSLNHLNEFFVTALPEIAQRPISFNDFFAILSDKMVDDHLHKPHYENPCKMRETITPNDLPWLH